MNYQQSINYLQELSRFGINPGLTRIKELLHRLDNPERKIKTIHVGGTNGKGSAIAFLQSILQKAGYNVGAFTSPHLTTYRERMVFNSRMISEEELASLFTDLREHIDAMLTDGYEQPTEFEVLTAAAMLWFAELRPDIVLLEVGLGGAIDSTNVVIPEISVITNVSIDHTAYLGRTTAEIAAVKSGIIKQGVPLVTACEDEEALKVIERYCTAMHAPLYRLGTEFRIDSENSDLNNSKGMNKGIRSLTAQSFAYHGIESSYIDILIGLQGDHQKKNAAAVLACCEILRSQGWKIDENAIRAGLIDASWPGRLEWLSMVPPVLIDAAHNHAGAVSLRNYLDQLKKNDSYIRLILVIGMLDDKEREKCAAELYPLADLIIVTKPNSPRAAHWYELETAARSKYGIPAIAEENIEQAVDMALYAAELWNDGRKDQDIINELYSDCRQDNNYHPSGYRNNRTIKTDAYQNKCIVCITGSIYMIGEVREIVFRKIKMAINN